jgi:hypothetical protein
MADRLHIILFGLQVTIFGGILAFTSTSPGFVIGVAFLGLIISAFGLLGRGT